jgi:uncharacterized membrane protein YgaE (UPF0421/DUF939 family)
MKAVDHIFIGTLVGMLISAFVWGIFTTPNQSKQIIILRDSLDKANKSVLYYRTQYLKANTQLIEIKQKCIYCAD